MKVVGLQRKRYPEIRTIIDPLDGKVEFRLSKNNELLDEHLREQAVRSTHFHSNSAIPDCDGVDIFHFFNTIPLNRVPFVTTFETAVPRWWGVDESTWRMGMDILGSPLCRGLIAISQNAMAIHEDTVGRRAPAWLVDNILQKTKVLHPPQKQGPIDLLDKFYDDDVLRVGFVGGEILRKGGLEFLEAASELLCAGAKLEAHIVSETKPRNTNAPWDADGAARLDRVRSIAANHPGIIHLHGKLRAGEVMELLSRCHIAVLPSYEDTYGYSVLEAQSLCCPVITTNQRAFPEINNQDTGWIIDLPLKGFGSVDVTDFKAVSIECRHQLVRVLSSIMGSPRSELRDKARAGWKRIGDHHNPAVAADRILALY